MSPQQCLCLLIIAVNLWSRSHHNFCIAIPPVTKPNIFLINFNNWKTHQQCSGLLGQTVVILKNVKTEWNYFEQFSTFSGFTWLFQAKQEHCGQHLGSCVLMFTTLYFICLIWIDMLSQSGISGLFNNILKDTKVQKE